MKQLFILALMCMSFSIQAQLVNDADKFKPRFFTANQMRFSAAFHFDIGPARFDKKIDDMNGGIYLDYGLRFDLQSPLSVVGLTFGGGLKVMEHSFENSSIGKDSIYTSFLNFPAYLRMKTGSLGQGNRAVFMFGGAYNLPLSGTLENDLGESLKTKEMLQSYIDLRGQIGWEILVGKNQKKDVGGGEIIRDARMRFLIYLGVSYSLNSPYNSDFSTNSTYYNNRFEQLSSNKSMNYYLGVDYYLQLTGWKHVGVAVLQAL